MQRGVINELPPGAPKTALRPGVAQPSRLRVRAASRREIRNAGRGRPVNPQARTPILQAQEFAWFLLRSRCSLSCSRLHHKPAQLRMRARRS
jgi:hypothetical protein